tara:strand:- start:190 stop:408 length:219 start_codon:yes stop_codon:yes gene_type:complete
MQKKFLFTLSSTIFVENVLFDVNSAFIGKPTLAKSQKTAWLVDIWYHLFHIYSHLLNFEPFNYINSVTAEKP